MIMTGVSLVLIGILTPIYAQFIRDAGKVGSTYTYESDDIWMVEVSEELKFLDIHYQNSQ